MSHTSFRCVFVALALLTTGPTAARSNPADTIVVRLRHSYLVCAGYCPHIEVWVSPTGQVASRRLSPDGGAYWWKAKRKNLEAFRRILATVRPRGYEQLDETCRPSDRADDPRPDDVAVNWVGVNSNASLTSCSYTHLPIRSTIERALQALDIDLSSAKQGSDW
jgi:hypothetical protein